MPGIFDNMRTNLWFGLSLTTNPLIEKTQNNSATTNPIKVAGQIDTTLLMMKINARLIIE